MNEKFKALVSNDQLFYSMLIILVGVSAFMMGRYSVSSEQAATIAPVQVFSAHNTNSNLVPAAVMSVVDSAPEGSAAAVEPATAVVVVASKNGTKYHLPTCPGAKQIKEANLVRFASIEQARAAGYSPAANCAGLE